MHHRRGLKGRARQRVRVCIGDRHGGVGLLPRRGRHVFRHRRRFEAFLMERRRGVLDANRRRLKVEGFGRGEGLVFLRELGGMITVVDRIRAVARVVVVEVSGKGRRHGGLLKSRRVGRGLTPKLGEVEIGACPITKIHRLVKLSLGPESVEDDPVECDHDHLNHDLDDGADQ